MASDPALNSPGFSIPSLATYQQALRQNAVDTATKDSKGWHYPGLLAAGVFDLTRSLGMLSPQERKVASANQVQQDAVRQTTATDPAEARLQQLTYMAQKFNQLGLSDLAAQVMPELNALTQRKVEMRKLTGEADKAVTDADVAKATEGANIDKPYLANLGEVAGTNLKNAQRGEIPSQIAKNTADAALARTSATEKGAERVTMINPDTKNMVSILKANTPARDSMAKAGYVETGVNLAPTKLSDLDLPKKTQSDLNTALINSQTQLDQITATLGTYKPEYLQWGGKAQFEALAVADKAGVPLSAQQHSGLAAYQAFHTDAIKGLNQYIHDLTGAQMSAAEADRLRQAIADPQRSSPTEFLSAMHETIKSIMRQQARLKSWKQGAEGTTADAPYGNDWDRIALPPISDVAVDQFMKARIGASPSTVKTPSAAGTKPASDSELLKKWGG